MTDPTTLQYDFDEERVGFGPPARRPAPPASLSLKISALFIGLGALALVVGMAGAPMAGTWGGLLLGFGPLLLGTAGVYWFKYKDSSPGIKHDDNTFTSTQARGLIGWGLAVFLTGFYVVLYWFPQHLERAVGLLEPLSQAMRHGPADQWFLYGFLYTAAVWVFGLRMVMKYRHNRYQLMRTASVMFFQLVFAFWLPGLLKALNQPEFYFTYFWPLKYGYLWPGSLGMEYIWKHPGGLGLWMVTWGVFATLVFAPALAFLFGKRWYCSWVCGCGALAETLGDPWRQLSNKSTRAWQLERWLIHAVLIVLVVITAMLWRAAWLGGVEPGSLIHQLAKGYGFVIGAAFSGVIGVGFYPLLGSRVWCRFGCPMAALMGIQQRLFSRFRITTNGGQCMSCGTCSSYCEMGIDVRAYAQERANIVRASCVGCGVCAAVCPRGVLKLENGDPRGRYPGSEKPVRSVLSTLFDPRIPQ